jgi:alpha-beta hydrolase superfamily lysophospholipase
MNVWQPDLLGPGWQARTLTLRDDDEGPVVATLVRRSPLESHEAAAAPRRRAVLHVHGFNDYFFQTHLAEQWEAHGYDFYALDLRKCGRSIRPWQTPHYCTDLREYSEELTTAARIVRDELGHDTLVVHAHSTGGLTASLWAHSMRRTDVVDALVLNSPWFDLNAHWFRRVVQTQVVEALGSLDPRRVVSHGASPYSRSLHVSNGGEWDFDLTLKPPGGYPARAGWVRAVRRGHSRLARGLAISVPVLVCSAQRSGPNTEENPDLRRSDTVLDVRQIAAKFHLLGSDVTYEPIPDAVHDLTLAARPARDAYFRVVFSWLAGHAHLADPAAPETNPEGPWQSVGTAG